MKFFDISGSMRLTCALIFASIASSNADASSCSSALAKYNGTSHEQNIQALAKYKELFGIAMPKLYADFPYNPAGCPKIIIYYKWRIPLEEKLIRCKKMCMRHVHAHGKTAASGTVLTLHPAPHYWRNSKVILLSARKLSPTRAL